MHGGFHAGLRPGGAAPVLRNDQPLHVGAVLRVDGEAASTQSSVMSISSERDSRSTRWRARNMRARAVELGRSTSMKVRVALGRRPARTARRPGRAPGTTRPCATRRCRSVLRPVACRAPRHQRIAAHAGEEVEGHFGKAHAGIVLRQHEMVRQRGLESRRPARCPRSWPARSRRCRSRGWRRARNRRRRARRRATPRAGRPGSLPKKFRSPPTL